MKDEKEAVSLTSSVILHPSSFRRSAFTLIEMLTTVAILIIVLGLMVSLAREVRLRSAEVLTKELLTHLDELAQSFKERNKGRLPNVEPIVAANATQIDEAKVRATARINNESLVRELKGEIVRSGLLQHDNQQGGGLGGLPISLFDGRMLADAWGNPIVFMPNQHPLIGMAPVRAGEEEGQAYFFFSPGPDGRYLTREDNLYSYEQGSRR